MREQWIEGNNLYTSGTFKSAEGSRFLICVATPMDKVAELVEAAYKEANPPEVGAFGFIKKAARGIGKGAAGVAKGTVKGVSKTASAIKLDKVVKHPLISTAIKTALPVGGAMVPGGTVAMMAAKVIKDSVVEDREDKRVPNSAPASAKSKPATKTAAPAKVMTDEEMSAALAPKFAVGGYARGIRVKGKKYRGPVGNTVIRVKGTFRRLPKGASPGKAPVIKGMRYSKGKWARIGDDGGADFVKITLPAVGDYPSLEAWIAPLPIASSIQGERVSSELDHV